MKKSHVLLVFTFLLLIPYICSLTIIGIGYDALVLHSADLFRTSIGAFVGALIMFAIKATIQRPVDLLAVEVDDGLLKQLLRFFSIRRRPLLQLANMRNVCCSPISNFGSDCWQIGRNRNVSHVTFNLLRCLR